jgi:predicted ABC-type ATPase
MLNCWEFVNADEIAKGLSPFKPESASFESGRIMLNRINELLAEGKDFAFETTLSTRSYVSYIKKAKENGYKVTLLFFWLDSVTAAKERVKYRVKHGGHDIREDVIERRYKRGIWNFFNLYLSKVDYWLIFDNTHKPMLIADGINTIDFKINNPDIWTKILNGK